MGTHPPIWRKTRSTSTNKKASAAKMGKADFLKQTEDDIVVVDAVRTPITRAKKGGLASLREEDLLSIIFKAILDRTKIDPKLVEDVAVGNVLPPGGGATIARAALLHAGYPSTTALNTLNRQCSSGLAAVNQIANEISTGQIDIGIGAGAESMTTHYGPGAGPDEVSETILGNQEASDCLIPMGITSENVAAQYKVTRQAQDAFAAKSFEKASAAQKNGWFKSEIVSVNVKKDDGSTNLVEHDDGIRAGVSPESLSKLKPAFAKDGTTHAGNASQVSDGAAACLLMKRKTAKKLGLPVLGKFVTAVSAGVPPKIMGIGPAVAIPKLLHKVGLGKEDIDFYEINEAFASQVVMSIEAIGLPYEKVNPNGGAIAFGHPLGATGARQIATGYAVAKRTGAKLFVTSMCVGSGMGMAALFVNES